MPMSGVTIPKVAMIVPPSLAASNTVAAVRVTSPRRKLYSTAAIVLRPTQPPAEDGDEAAAHPRPHGDALQEADDDGPADGEILHAGALVGPQAAFSIVARDQEDDDAADQPGGRDRPQGEQIPLDELLAQQPDHGRGHERGDEDDREPSAVAVASQDAAQDRHEAAPVQDDDCHDGAELDGDGVGVSGCLQLGIVGDAEQVLGEQKMPRGADRQVLGDAFDNAEDDGVDRAERLGFGGFVAGLTRDRDDRGSCSPGRGALHGRDAGCESQEEDGSGKGASSEDREHRMHRTRMRGAAHLGDRQGRPRRRDVAALAGHRHARWRGCPPRSLRRQRRLRRQPEQARGVAPEDGVEGII